MLYYKLRCIGDRKTSMPKLFPPEPYLLPVHFFYFLFFLPHKIGKPQDLYQ